jgi:hypothetical protein
MKVLLVKGSRDGATALFSKFSLLNGKNLTDLGLRQSGFIKRI